MGPKGLIIIILLVIGSNVLSSKRDKNYVNRTQDNKAYNINNHYNSIKYRYNNISEILGMDLDDPQNRFDLSLLVKIYLYSLDVKELDLLISGC